MSAAKANNNKDTYKATAITLIVFGVLYLADKLLHFSTLGLSWVMNRDNSGFQFHLDGRDFRVIIEQTAGKVE